MKIFLSILFASLLLLNIFPTFADESAPDAPQNLSIPQDKSNSNSIPDQNLSNTTTPDHNNLNADNNNSDQNVPNDGNQNLNTANQEMTPDTVTGDDDY